MVVPLALESVSGEKWLTYFKLFLEGRGTVREYDVEARGRNGPGEARALEKRMELGLDRDWVSGGGGCLRHAWTSSQTAVMLEAGRGTSGEERCEREGLSAPMMGELLVLVMSVTGGLRMGGDLRAFCGGVGEFVEAFAGNGPWRAVLADVASALGERSRWCPWKASIAVGYLAGDGLGRSVPFDSSAGCVWFVEFAANCARVRRMLDNSCASSAVTAMR